MKRNTFFRKKAVVYTFLVVLIMCFASTIVPVVQSTNTMNMFKKLDVSRIEQSNEVMKSELFIKYENLLELIYDINSGDKNIESLTQSDFETYWEFYGRAKGYWSAYLPAIGFDDPTPVIDRGVMLWSADNYHDWYAKAGLQIWGDEETRQLSQMSIVNLLIIGFDIITLTVGSSFFAAGLPGLTGGYLLASTLLYGIAAGLTTVMLAYDMINLFYFLFGVNAYYTLLDYGNVNIVIDVVNETNVTINNCEINVHSSDAFNKSEESPDWDGWKPSMTRWDWSKSEFEYILLQSGDDIDGRYSLFEFSQDPEFRKAVPPPGVYNITVDPPEDWVGPDAEGISFDTVSISPNESYNKVVVLNVTKNEE